MTRRAIPAPAAIGVVLLLGSALLPSPRLGAAEVPRVALARLDSLIQVVFAEEARVVESPKVEANWDRLARAWYQVGNHTRAVQALEQARMLGAREYDTMLLLGRAARTELRLADAKRWLERVVRVRPDDWEPREDLGLTYYLLGDLSAAAEHWRLAAALTNSGSPSRAGLLEVLQQAGSGYQVSGAEIEALPFKFGATATTRASLPGVEVRLAGRGPFLLRIDPGSAEATLDPELADELGLARVSGLDPRRPATARRDYALLDSLQLGGITIRRVPVAIAPGRPGFRGALGFEVLRRFRFGLDYPAGVLQLERGDAAADSLPSWVGPNDRAHAVPIVLRGTHLVIAYGTLGRGPERPFLLDVGASGIGYAAPMSTLAEALIPVDTTRVLEGTSSSGAVRYHPLDPARLCLAEVCVDSVAGVYGIFPETLELNPSFRVAGMVSHGFLSRFRFGVDLPRRRVWLVEPGYPNPRPKR